MRHTDVIAYIWGLLISFNMVFLIQGCGTYNESEEKEDPEIWIVEDSESDSEDFDEEAEVKRLKAELDASEDDPDDESAYLWTLDEIESETYFCEDEYWYKIDDADRFCLCRTEMLSVRWTWIDYKHHPSSYVKRLDQSGALKRCTEPEKFLEPDEPEAIEEDAEWTPEEEDSVWDEYTD